MMKTGAVLILVSTLCLTFSISLGSPGVSKSGWTDLAAGTDLEGIGANSGVAWGDYDGDGLDDLYVSQFDEPNLLFHNEGDGVFTAVTSELNNPGNGTCGYWGDFNNDGSLDMFVLQAMQENFLFRNTGNSQFEDVPLPIMNDTDDSWAGAFVDYDSDGLLDLYISNFDAPNQLLHNDGNGDFSFMPGILDYAGASQGCAWADFDNDGDEDLYLVNGAFEGNILYRNDGQGSFTDVTTAPLNDMGAGQGAAWGDYDNDGDLDLYITNWGKDNKLFRNDGYGAFTHVVQVDLGTFEHSQSATWGDYDNDGDLDLYVASNGAPNGLLQNDGAGNFTNISDLDPILADSRRSIGAAWSDCDNDGDLDLFVTNHHTTNILLANNLDPGNHWLHLKLVGTVSNRSAIGARVRIVAGGNSWIREVNGGSGYLSQNSLMVELGLGMVSSVDSVQVTWPIDDGSGEFPVQTLTDVMVDQVLTVTESTGDTSAAPDILPVGYVLNDNYPNPFNPQTFISFELPEESRINLMIFDMAGHLVRTLVADETLNNGRHEVAWNGRSTTGEHVAAGVYLYRLSGEGFSKTRRMTLVK